MEVNKEVALAVSFQADDEGFDRIADMLVSKSMQFTGGECGRIILGYGNEDEEIPPVLGTLLLGLMKGDLDFGQDMVGYIRNESRESVTAKQTKDIEDWFTANVQDFKVGNLVDLWG